MNLKNIKLATFTLVALSLALFSSSVLAGGCQKVKAIENGVLNPDMSGASGTITQGGKLNGTSQVVLTTGFAPTADPFTYSFTDNFTLTTNEGVLRTQNVSLLNLATGASTAIARIDPNAGEGAFAGATGVLYFNGRPANTEGAFQVEITGEICFAD